MISSSILVIDLDIYMYTYQIVSKNGGKKYCFLPSLISRRARVAAYYADPRKGKKKLPVIHALHFLSIHFLHFVLPPPSLLASASLPSLNTGLSKKIPFSVTVYRLITADNTKHRALWRRRRCVPPARSCSRTLCNSGFIHGSTLLAIGPSRDSRLHPLRLGN